MSGGGLKDVERPYPDVRNTAGKTLTGLARQVHGRGAQDQEAAGSVSPAPSLTDQPALHREEFPYTNESRQGLPHGPRSFGEKGGIEELFAVFARAKFEIHRRRLSRNHVGKLRLADLTRANRGDGGVPRTRLPRSLRARRAIILDITAGQ